MKKIILVSIVVLAGLGFWWFGRAPAPIVVKLQPGPAQPRVSLEEAGIDAVAIDEAVQYAAARNTRALVVGRGGHIVFEKYWGETNFDTPLDLSGFAPVLAALSVGSALNDRVITTLDGPLSNYVPEEAGTPAGVTTLRELLSQDNVALDAAASANRLALVLERLTKLPYEQIVTERLWKPLEAGDLEFAKQGGEGRLEGASAGCCIRARLGDWMRVGEILANDGVFEGNQFTSPRYVSLMLNPSHKDSPRGYFTRVDGAFSTHDVARIEAEGKQRLWVVPSLRLVILRVGDEPDASKGWDETMIPNSIIRGTSGWRPRSASEGVDPGKFAPH